MLGKTFKGLTDELLTWQTARFLELEVRRTAGTVYVEPSTVVEIACDGLQVSTRYPGGVALRFARVLRYRPDKSAAEADTIDTVKALSPIIDALATAQSFAARARTERMDKPASLATRTLRQTLLSGSWLKQKHVGRMDKSGARGFGCWLWISRPHATSSYTVGSG